MTTVVPQQHSSQHFNFATEGRELIENPHTTMTELTINNDGLIVNKDVHGLILRKKDYITNWKQDITNLLLASHNQLKRIKFHYSEELAQTLKQHEIAFTQEIATVDEYNIEALYYPILKIRKEHFGKLRAMIQSEQIQDIGHYLLYHDRKIDKIKQALESEQDQMLDYLFNNYYYDDE